MVREGLVVDLMAIAVIALWCWLAL
jgi:hypothetical protein